MDQPFLGMIALFGFNFAPRGWAICQGQLLSIAQNTALFSLLGTTYGGDGITTFALPDLRGRVPLGQGQGPGLSNYVIGEVTGSENVTLISTQMPAHSHALMVSGTPATAATPVNNVMAVASGSTSTGDPVTVNAYGPTPNAIANPNSIGASGGNQPFPIVQPILAMNYCIALEGIFPSRN
jgi:microcystin-dependent protein